MPQAFERVVVQIDVRELDFTLRERIRIHGEVVVVRGDLDFSRTQLLHGMISAVVSKLQLESFSAESNPCELMAKAYPEDWLPAHESPNVIYRIGAGLGVARTIRE